MDSCLQQEGKWMNAHKKAVGLYNRYKEEVCTKKGKDVSIVEGGVGGGAWVHNRTIEERVY